jgi:hypothetical protein
VVSPATASTIVAHGKSQIVTNLLVEGVCGCLLVALCRSQTIHGADNGSTRSRRNIEHKITVFKILIFLWKWRQIETNVKFLLLVPFKRIMVPKTINILLFIIGKKYKIYNC